MTFNRTMLAFHIRSNIGFVIYVYLSQLITLNKFEERLPTSPDQWLLDEEVEARWRELRHKLKCSRFEVRPFRFESHSSRFRFSSTLIYTFLSTRVKVLYARYSLYRQENKSYQENIVCSSKTCGDEFHENFHSIFVVYRYARIRHYIAAETTVLVESSNSVLKRVIGQLEAIGTKSIRIIAPEETMSLCRWRYWSILKALQRSEASNVLGIT